MTTLVSFLGKQIGGYMSSTYEFSDGTLMENQKYMGLALVEKIKPRKLILLGTSGSMWDVFLAENSQGLDEEWIELVEAVNIDQVTAEMLMPFSQYLTEKLDIHVECILISTAQSEAEQISILSELSRTLTPKEKVVLDITHSFRHLPLLALVAARLLKTTHEIEVEQIYYGNFLYGEKVHPVLELKGLLNMLDWVDALSTFDKDGDYGPFTQLLEKEGLSPNDAMQLKQAAFFERTTNSSNARQKLSTVRKEIENFNSPIFDLFKPQLLKRLQWFTRGGRGLQEQQLAKAYLERHDYLRAVIYALEGMISAKTISAGKDENSYEDRENQRHILKENDSFRLFSSIRNALTHGLGRDVNKDVKRILSDEKKMEQSLKDRFKHLLD